jgi:hypothetical protein
MSLTLSPLKSPTAIAAGDELTGMFVAAPKVVLVHISIVCVAPVFKLDNPISENIRSSEEIPILSL